jgi:hypothetical protein
MHPLKAIIAQANGETPSGALNDRSNGNSRLKPSTMNNRVRILFLPLLCGLLLSSRPIHGQTLVTVHNFTNTPDGANPRGGLILSGGFLYGTTQQGGTP